MCVCVCVCVCVLNKVEVWSSAIAARGSYARPESLLGLRAATFAELSPAEYAAHNTATHSVSPITLHPGYLADRYRDYFQFLNPNRICVTALRLNAHCERTLEL